MPGLQWLGTIPEENEWSYVAQALKGGVEGYLTGRQQALQRQQQLLQTGLQLGQYQLSREKFEQQKQEFKERLARTDREQKIRLLNIVNNALSNMLPSAQREYLAQPEVQALYEDLGVKPPSQLIGKSQQSRIAKAMAAIKTKSVPSSMLGVPTPLPSRKKMETYITLTLQDPNWRENYPEIAEEFDKQFPLGVKTEEEEEGWLSGLFKRKKKQKKDKYGFIIGETRTVNGKKWRYIGGDKWEMVE